MLNNKPNSQIPQCACHISHNAPFRTFWKVHCGIWDRGTAWFMRLVYRCDLTHWDWDNMAEIWQTFPNTFHQIKNFVFWLNFSDANKGSDQVLMLNKANRRWAIVLSNVGLVYWRIYVLLSHNVLSVMPQNSNHIFLSMMIRKKHLTLSLKSS